jgi:hypothetical protein
MTHSNSARKADETKDDLPESPHPEVQQMSDYQYFAQEICVVFLTAQRAKSRYRSQ